MNTQELLEQFDDLQLTWPRRFQVVLHAEIIFVVEAEDADQALVRAKALSSLTQHSEYEQLQYSIVEMHAFEPVAHRFFTEGFFMMREAQHQTQH